MQRSQEVPGQSECKQETRGITEIKLVVIGDGGCGKTSMLMVFAKGEFPERSHRCIDDVILLANETSVNKRSSSESIKDSTNQHLFRVTKCNLESDEEYLQIFSINSAEVYVPTVFEKYFAPFRISDKQVHISLWDTAGQEDYDRLRPLSYNGAHAVIICYDVTNPISFNNILTKWYPEANHFCKGIPILLVGCKTDLRKDKVLLRKLHQNQLEPITYQKGEALARNLRAVAYFECSALYHENITDIFTEASRAALSRMKKQHQKQRLKRTCLLT